MAKCWCMYVHRMCMHVHCICVCIRSIMYACILQELPWYITSRSCSNRVYEQAFCQFAVIQYCILRYASQLYIPCKFYLLQQSYEEGPLWTSLVLWRGHLLVERSRYQLLLCLEDLVRSLLQLLSICHVAILQCTYTQLDSLLMLTQL